MEKPSEKHLDLIQSVTERLARNSFLLKGWAVTLVAACFLLAVRGADPTIAIVAALLPCFTFWGLDAYYLRQERMYRRLYDAVRNGEVANDPYTLDANPFRNQVPGWFGTVFSPTTSIFYVVVILVVTAGLTFFTLKVT